jgi:hypothetical protein
MKITIQSDEGLPGLCFAGQRGQSHTAVLLGWADVGVNQSPVVDGPKAVRGHTILQANLNTGRNRSTLVNTEK